MSMLINEYPLIVLPQLAVKYGLNEAIVIQQIHYWLSRATHVHQDKTWCYNTIKDWQLQFPFWSERTIKRIIKNLCDQKVIIKGNFNKSKFDRTLWYSLNYAQIEVVNALGQNGIMTSGQIGTMGSDKVTQPIPETNTETTTEITSCFSFDEFWNKYDKKQSRVKAKMKYIKVSEDDRSLIKATLADYVLSTPDKQYRKDPCTYLNNKSWHDEIIKPSTKHIPGATKDVSLIQFETEF